jgi:hypothetical protein
MENKKTIKMNKRQLIISLITIAIIGLAIFGASYSYLGAHIGSPTSSSLMPVTNTVGNLYFVQGNGISITGQDFSLTNELGGNTIDTKTLGTATAVAKYTSSTANTYGYYDGYLIIGENSFVSTMGITNPEANLTQTGTNVDCTFLHTDDPSHKVTYSSKVNYTPLSGFTFPEPRSSCLYLSDSNCYVHLEGKYAYPDIYFHVSTFDDTIQNRQKLYKVTNHSGNTLYCSTYEPVGAISLGEPEIILQIKDPASNNYTANIEGLTYYSTYGGYDITGKKGIFKFADDASIGSSVANSTLTYTWQFTVNVVNAAGLANDQNANANARLSAGVILTGKDLTAKEVVMASGGGASAIQAKTSAINPIFGTAAAVKKDKPEWESSGVCNFQTNQYVTYSSTYSIDETPPPFKLGTKSTCIYSSCYSSLVGKYVYPTTSASSTAQGENLTELYKVTSATAAGATCDTYSLGTYSNYDLRDTGLFAINEDSDSTYSYIYRGAVENNWVQFNGKMWRIVRVNVDGSIRLLYGTVSASQVQQHINSNDFLYTNRIWGYHYPAGTTAYGSSSSTPYASSTLKTALDNWYSSNMSAVDSLVLSEKYCTNITTGIITSVSCGTSYYTGKVGALSWKEYKAIGTPGRHGSMYNYASPIINSYWLMPTENDSYALCASAPDSGLYERCGYNVSTVEYRPVINVNGDVVVTGGSGQIDDPYVFGTSLVS